MKKHVLNILNTSLIISSLTVASARADSDVEKAVLEQIIKATHVTAREMDNEKISKCFAGTLYAIEVKMDLPQGKSTNEGPYMKTDTGLHKITMPSMGGTEMSTLMDTVNPDFKLKTVDDGKAMQEALAALYPSAVKRGVEQQVIQDGTSWSFIMGKFFDNYSGFIIETNAKGEVTKISRGLGIKVE